MLQSIETGRKEDGNRSIADKIIKRLHDLEMTIENNHGRWAWELLQNAKDSVADTERKVSVEIELNENDVVFRHNGNHFSEKDIRGLINQITSKEVEEGEKSKKIGKFGTGFLTTHLLSKIIEVAGIIETADKNLYNFSFPLNRNGKTTSQLIPNIENAWKAFHISTEGNQITNYEQQDFNTSFAFNLETIEQKEIAQKGVNEFIQLIPFVLTFIPQIESVKIINRKNSSTLKFENTDDVENEVLKTINKTENQTKSKIKLLFAKADDVSIAAIVETTNTGFEILNLEDFPKLFCDFPLIGKEAFHFPVIINSFYFNPLTERDGIWLKGDGKVDVEENREILKKAVKLYEILLEKITELNFYNYYNICLSKIPDTNQKFFDPIWYKDSIQNSLREIISKSKVVETENGKKIVLNKAHFPDPNLFGRSERIKIWQFNSDLELFNMPKKRHIQVWSNLIWEDCNKITIETIVTEFSYHRSVEDLIYTLKISESQTFIWLNDFIQFIYKIDGQNQFNKYAIIPNQEGEFIKLKDLFIDEIVDEHIKEIADLLGYNYYIDLIHSEVIFEDFNSVKSFQDAAFKITQLINDYDKNIFKKGKMTNGFVEAPNHTCIFRKGEIVNLIDFNKETNLYSIDSKNGKRYNVEAKYIKLHEEKRIIGIRKLSEWFDDNSEKGKTYFSELYDRKEKLFVETIDDKENLYRVLKTTIPLSKLAEIAKTIENDPEILKIIEIRQKEKEDEKERNEMGERVEKVLAEALQQHGFEVKKEIYGKDLVIALKKKKTNYFIEVKSISIESYVSMTPLQAKTSVYESGNYALCVIQKNVSEINKEYIINNANFIIDIGVKLTDKVKEVSIFENNKTEIANTNKDIDLFYENTLEYKYKISSNIWTKGKSFADFIKYISE